MPTTAARERVASDGGTLDSAPERAVTMNIGSVEGLSTVQTAQIRAQIDVAVLAKTHEAAKLLGEAALGLLESAAEVSHQTNDGDGRHVNLTA